MIVLGDENLCFMNDPETKLSSGHWLNPNKTKDQNLGMKNRG
jgi:hypothetical protein